MYVESFCPIIGFFASTPTTEKRRPSISICSVEPSGAERRSSLQ